MRHCQVDENHVDHLPRCWALARRGPSMLGIKNSRQPQLDNTSTTPSYLELVIGRPKSDIKPVLMGHLLSARRPRQTTLVTDTRPEEARADRWNEVQAEKVKRRHYQDVVRGHRRYHKM